MIKVAALVAAIFLINNTTVAIAQFAIFQVASNIATITLENGNILTLEGGSNLTLQ